jgi:hypothetical protein
LGALFRDAVQKRGVIISILHIQRRAWSSVVVKALRYYQSEGLGIDPQWVDSACKNEYQVVYKLLGVKTAGA